MNNDINIEETNNFDGVQAYLQKVNSSLDTLINDINDIEPIATQGLTKAENIQTMKSFYNSEAGSAKALISDLKSKATNAIGHINNSVSTYLLADQMVEEKINEIYDSIFADEDYQTKLMYHIGGDDEKLSYEQYVELLNNSTAYFNSQRQQVYNKFMLNMAIAGPTMMKSLGTKTFNGVVENAYFYISDERIGTDTYTRGLTNFKNKFADVILTQYDNTDFIPECYIEGQDKYNTALLALTFDNKNLFNKKDMVLNALAETDERCAANINEIDIHTDLIYTFYTAKDLITNLPQDAEPKELLDYYSEQLSFIKDLVAVNHDGSKPVFFNDFSSADYDVWYDSIKDTEAFKKIKDLLPSDSKEDIYSYTNNYDFFAAIYQYDGMETLQKISYNYLDNQWGSMEESNLKQYLLRDILSPVVNFASTKNMLGTLSEPIAKTRSELATINDSESTALLLFSKSLDTSDVTAADRETYMKDLDTRWNNYCHGKDYHQYLEDWQIDAYIKVFKNDKDLAAKLFNMSEGGDRGVLNDKIMEGYAFDVAKNRVMEMTKNGDIFNDIKGLIFSGAYGFGYGLTDFTTGIGNVIQADGKMNYRDLEKSYILSLMSNDYSLEFKYFNQDPELMHMMSTDYTGLNISDILNDNFDSIIAKCKANNVPRYELEYMLGNISHEDMLSYQQLENMSKEDLAYYANLYSSGALKWLSDKTFKVSNAVGTQAIPVGLTILSSALAPVGGLTPLGLSTNAASLLSRSAAIASYSSMFASSYGRNKEDMMVNGQVDNYHIAVNSFLHAGLETFGEMILGKVLGPTEVSEFVKGATKQRLPFLSNLINASDNIQGYLLRSGCNPTLAKFFSNIAGEVVQENLENVLGHGIDAATYEIFRGELYLPSMSELLNEAWETTWMTALTTPILNGLSDFAMSNVRRKVPLMGTDAGIALSDLLRFSDGKTIDYKSLSEYLISTGRMPQIVLENQVVNTVNDIFSRSNGGIADFSAMIEELPENSSIAMFLKDMHRQYSEGNEAAITLYNKFFTNFRDHGFAHALNVAAYTASISTDLNIDKNLALYAALSHDYGMKGGYHFIKPDKNHANSLKLITMIMEAHGLNTKNIKTLSDANTALTEALGGEQAQLIMTQYGEGKAVDIESLRPLFESVSDQKTRDSLLFKLDDFTRGNHPLNSAVAIITEGTVPDGMDPNVVALIAMTHSKSTSGIRHFDSKQEWNAAIDKLAATIDQYNKDHGTNHKLDVEGLKKLVADPTSFKKLIDTAVVVRDGDAWAKVVYEGDKLVMQDRSATRIEETSEGTGTPRGNDFNQPVEELAEELDTFHDYHVNPETGEYIIDENKKRVEIGEVGRELTKGETMSKQIHAGESNIVFGNNSTYDGENYSATAKPINANKYPRSTLFSILERINEVNTYTNATNRSFEIILPIEAKGTALGDFYENELSNIKSTLTSENIKEYANGDIIFETYNKQKVFYDHIIIRYE